MKLTVKILGGCECDVEVDTQTPIVDLKKELATKMNVPIESQKLVFKGRTLVDGTKIGDHTLEEGAKVHLVVIKAGPSTAESSSAQKPQEPEFWTALTGILSKHFQPSDVTKILKEYERDFENGLQSLNLDDIESMAANLASGEAGKPPIEMEIPTQV